MKLSAIPPAVIISNPKRANIKIEYKKQTSMSTKTPVARDLSTEIYDGTYIAYPKAHEETVFYTKNKIMLNDVRVMEIPYHETSNQSGTTAYIANEV